MPLECHQMGPKTEKAPNECEDGQKAHNEAEDRKYSIGQYQKIFGFICARDQHFARKTKTPHSCAQSLCDCARNLHNCAECARNSAKIARAIAREICTRIPQRLRVFCAHISHPFDFIKTPQEFLIFSPTHKIVTHKHTQTRTDTQRRTHIHTQTHKDTHKHTQTLTDTHRHTQAHTDTDKHTRTHADTDKDTNTHTQTHTHRHT